MYDIVCALYSYALALYSVLYILYNYSTAIFVMVYGISDGAVHCLFCYLSVYLSSVLSVCYDSVFSAVDLKVSKFESRPRKALQSHVCSDLNSEA